MFKINRTKIDIKSKPYVIAEISANHNGSIDYAKKTIIAAKNAGANAVKIQTYTPDTMTIESKKNDFLIKEGLWKNLSLYKLYKKAYTPYEWHKELFQFAKQNKITLFSTPFDETAVDLLEKLETPAYKIASFELVDLPLIKYVAKTKKPILMSTGMSTLEEITEAVETAKINGCKNILLFHCVSSYPALLKNSNLNSIKFLKKEFNVEVGLSDHTLDNRAANLSIALGATAIEKHFTLSRKNKGPDSKFSIEPKELKLLIKEIYDTHQALGKNGIFRSEDELKNKVFRRSLYFVKNIQKDQVITPEHIRRIRPGYGLNPKYYEEVIGKKATKSFKIGDRVTLKSFIR